MDSRRQSRIFEPGLIFYCDTVTAPSRSIRVLADHCNISYDLRFVDIFKGEQRKPLFLTINSKGNLPVIVDDGFMLTESPSILKYLAETRNLPDNWYPSSLMKRARVNELLDWNYINLHKFTHEIFGNFKEDIGKLIFLKKGTLVDSNHKIDSEAIAKAHLQLKECYSFLDEKLKIYKYLIGEDPSIADLAIACELVMSRLWKFDLSQYSNLHGFLSRMEQLGPAWQQNHKHLEHFQNKLVSK